MSDNMATKLRKQIGGRNMVAKIVGFALLGAIGIVFVFSTEMAGQMGMGLASVARVNDSLISAADLQSQETQIQEYYNNLFGGGMNLGAQRNMLRQQALETLIRSELTSQAAHEAGIRATDAEIREVIVRDIPAFQENGQFLRERYLGYLQATRMSPGDFESRLRKDVESVRVRQLLEVAAHPLPLEVEKMKELLNQKMNVSFARLDIEALGKSGVTVEAAQVQSSLQDPEFMKTAEDYFQTYKADWSTPETATAQHLLIAFEPNNPESERKALAQIQELRTRAEKEDFGALAAEFSQDPGSKAQKGQLEPFARGRMVKEFEDAAFSQKLGELGPPVKTPFGYHLIKVSQRTQAKEANFEESKNEVARRLLARDLAETKAKELDDAVRAGEAQKVDQILSSLGVRWEETGLFDLAGAVPQLPTGPVAEAVFEVTSAKPLLGRVVRDGGARYVLRLKETKTEAAPVEDNAEEQLQKRRAESLFASWLEGFRENSRVDVNPQVFNQ